MFEAKVIADSINPYGCRLTTMTLTYPRIIHSEFMTHRMFSRNASSSRAIPAQKQIEAVRRDPFIPIYWGKNQKGMQARQELSEDKQSLAYQTYIQSLRKALDYADSLNELGCHKQLVNRIIEPYSWITVLATGTDPAWANFFHLRCHKDAEPHIHHIANKARSLYTNSSPKQLDWYEWHLPFIREEEFEEGEYNVIQVPQEISVARCARVSYLNHEGVRDTEEDLKLFDKLRTSGHWSPFEHVAFVPKKGEVKRFYEGNFVHRKNGPFQMYTPSGWHQFRKMFATEFVSTLG